MEKPAQNDHPIHDLIKRRWSPRAFSRRPVEPEAVRSLLEAARWAPSSLNEQPWHFIIAARDQPEAFERMLGCLVPGNQRWAKDVPLLMISVVRRARLRDGKPNRCAFHDTGLAVASLVFQAMSLGLFVHQMGGIDRENIRKTYAIPEGYNPMAGIAVGYPGDPHSLPDDIREQELAPRTRKGLDEFVFSERWGEAAKGVES